MGNSCRGRFDWGKGGGDEWCDHIWVYFENIGFDDELGQDLGMKRRVKDDQNFGSDHQEQVVFAQMRKTVRIAEGEQILKAVLERLSLSCQWEIQEEKFIRGIPSSGEISGIKVKFGSQQPLVTNLLR